MRHRSMSSKSWHKHKHNHCNEGCLDDFCAGYRQGYEDVAAVVRLYPEFFHLAITGGQHQISGRSEEGFRLVRWLPARARAAEEEVLEAGRKSRCPATCKHSMYELACCPIAVTQFTRLPTDEDSGARNLYGQAVTG